jgi:hypothetical protein
MSVEGLKLNCMREWRMTVLEIKPHRNGWKVLEKDQAISYAQNRARFCLAIPRSDSSFFHRAGRLFL